MGNLIYQKIHSCDECGCTPEDGEKMWYMGSWGLICEPCINHEESKEAPDPPGFEGTTEALVNLCNIKVDL